MRIDTPFMGDAEITASDARFLRLLDTAVSRIPPGVPPLRTLRRVGLRRRGEMPGLVGLTRWGQVSYSRKSGGTGRAGASGTQTMTFYTGLLGRLSDRAAVGVVAHELAHAWLNEHLLPEESASREREADGLARQWGFSEELAALDRETEPF